jgi:hypothetical protein
MRLLRCDECTAARFRKKVQEQVEGGEISVAVEIHTRSGEQFQISQFAPLTR